MKIVTFDCETSGIDTENDRILTCFIRAKDGDKVVFEREWIIDPGVEIPKEASDIHGMTTEWIREHGRKDVEQAVDEIRVRLEQYAYSGYVVCGFNHSFDLAMLGQEVGRHLGYTFLTEEGVRYLDPCIFSRYLDKYKKGGHQLITVARRNGIKIEEDRLHSADYDVEVTEKLVPIMLNRAWKELPDVRGDLTPDQFVTRLQDWQAIAKSTWAHDLTEYFRKQGKTEGDGSPIQVSGAFPW